MQGFGGFGQKIFGIVKPLDSTSFLCHKLCPRAALVGSRELGTTITVKVSVMHPTISPKWLAEQGFSPTFHQVAYIL
jgi:hypothetical protein